MRVGKSEDNMENMHWCTDWTGLFWTRLPYTFLIEESAKNYHNGSRGSSSRLCVLQQCDFLGVKIRRKTFHTGSMNSTSRQGVQQPCEF